jgi:hypothetical protein
VNRPEKPGWYWVEIDGWTDEVEQITPEWEARKRGRVAVCVHVEDYEITGVLRAWVHHMDYAEELPLFEGNYNAQWMREAK